MKKLSPHVLLLVGVLFFGSCTSNKKTSETSSKNSSTLSNDIDSLSYALGVSIGESFKQQGLEELNYSLFVESIKNAYKDGATSLMSQSEAESCIANQFKVLEEKKIKAAKQAGIDYLEKNKSKPNVNTTASGLQYITTKEGQGESPAPDNTVSVHYEGRLIDGTVFDSSYERGEPASFGVTQVIKGWTEVLQLMKPGGKCTVVIPSELAYGERGAGQTIPPHSTLVFDIELLSVASKSE